MFPQFINVQNRRKRFAALLPMQIQRNLDPIHLKKIIRHERWKMLENYFASSVPLSKKLRARKITWSLILSEVRRGPSCLHLALASVSFTENQFAVFIGVSSNRGSTTSSLLFYSGDRSPLGSHAGRRRTSAAPW